MNLNLLLLKDIILELDDLCNDFVEDKGCDCCPNVKVCKELSEKYIEDKPTYRYKGVSDEYHYINDRLKTAGWGLADYFEDKQVHLSGICSLVDECCNCSLNILCQGYDKQALLVKKILEKMVENFKKSS